MKLTISILVKSIRRNCDPDGLEIEAITWPIPLQSAAYWLNTGFLEAPD
ncbi:hypothetical protein [Mycolicibacterium grossiae]|nr:hypothetical protein [Mycolicibacterium grossiae]